MSRRSRTIAEFLCLVTLLAAAPALIAQGVELINVSSAGTQGTQFSDDVFISSDGRFVVFRSSFLVPEDTRGSQIYLRDRLLDTTELVSQNAQGLSIDSSAELPSNRGGRGVSDDGRFVVFRSTATDLGVANPGRLNHIYLRDRENDTTILISKDSQGNPANGESTSVFAMSPDGGAVLFNSFADNLDVLDQDTSHNTYLHLLNGATTRLACFDAFGAKIQDCTDLSLSCTVQMAFRSGSSNVAPGDVFGGSDLYRGLPLNGNNEYLTLDYNGAETAGAHFDPVISCDGSRVLFRSREQLLFNDNDNDFDLYIFVHETGLNWLIRPDGESVRPLSADLSASGEWIAVSTIVSFADLDTNGLDDVYLMSYDKDRMLGTPLLVSQSGGQAANVSPNGSPRVADQGDVAFESAATNLVPGGDSNGTTQDILVGANELFIDGFESGNTARWSRTVP